jgi:uncharacterized membrane protein (UPF0127 family)
VTTFYLYQTMTPYHSFIAAAACVVSLACSADSNASDPRSNNRTKQSPAKQAADVTNKSGQSSSSASKANQAPQVVFMPPGRNPVAVKVEVASTPKARQRGLMYREYLPADGGMLFVFEEPQQLSFWMHNTYIPLDMIFISKDFSVIGVVENTKPLSDDSCSVPGLSQYVVEVNALFARRHGIAEGTRIRLSTTTSSNRP